MEMSSHSFMTWPPPMFTVMKLTSVSTPYLHTTVRTTSASIKDITMSSSTDMWLVNTIITGIVILFNVMGFLLLYLHFKITQSFYILLCFSLLLALEVKLLLFKNVLIFLRHG